MTEISNEVQKIAPAEVNAGAARRFLGKVVCFMPTKIIFPTYSVFGMWLLFARFGLYTQKLSTWKVAPGRSEVQGQPCSHTKLLGSLGFMRPCFEHKQINKATPKPTTNKIFLFN